MPSAAVDRRISPATMAHLYRSRRTPRRERTDVFAFGWVLYEMLPSKAGKLCGWRSRNDLLNSRTPELLEVSGEMGATLLSLGARAAGIGDHQHGE